MNRPHSPIAAIAAIGALGLFSPQAAENVKRVKENDTRIEVYEGPSTISPEEAAITADPAAGVEHAVILVEEAILDDNEGAIAEFTYHRRAKILSNEGRGLADLQMPVTYGLTSIKTFWAKTILPDGTVHKLDQKELKEQALVKIGGVQANVRKGALPAVVPGCVIDYGWVIRKTHIEETTSVAIQLAWPVRSFRYRWVPSQFFSGSYRANKTEGLDITIALSDRTILFTGKNIPPVQDETLMPPVEEVRAGAVLYYTEQNADLKDFWNTEAKRIERLVVSEIRGKNTLAAVVQTAGLAGSTAPPMERARTAYEWIVNNIKNTTRLSGDQADKEDPSESAPDKMKEVFETRSGGMRQITRLFIGVARTLGLDAREVRAADRTERFWDKNLLSVAQFDARLAAVRPLGTSDVEWMVVAPAYGLPWGELPWWVTGLPAFAAGSGGSTELALRAAEPRKNVSESWAEIGLAGEAEEASVSWRRRATGAAGQDGHATLRWQADADRQDELRKICGESGDFEISESTAKDLENLQTPFSFECKGVLALRGGAEGFSTVDLPIDGPWFEDVPDLHAGERKHPVILEAPRIDLATLDIKPPEGFAPTGARDPVTVSSKYGSYSLFYNEADGGYHIERMLRLAIMTVDPKEYGEFVEFLDAVRRADRSSVRFKRLQEEP